MLLNLFVILGISRGRASSGVSRWWASISTRDVSVATSYRRHPPLFAEPSRRVCSCSSKLFHFNWKQWRDAVTCCSGIFTEVHFVQNKLFAFLFKTFFRNIFYQGDKMLEPSSDLTSSNIASLRVNSSPLASLNVSLSLSTSSCWFREPLDDAPDLVRRRSCSWRSGGVAGAEKVALHNTGSWLREKATVGRFNHRKTQTHTSHLSGARWDQSRSQPESTVRAV